MTEASAGVVPRARGVSRGRAPQRDASTFVAECFWPDVREADLRELDHRIVSAVEEQSGHAEAVLYVTSILVAEDEVVLCVFNGSRVAVRRVAERAGIPCERILEAVMTRRIH
jgi:hypothetical protein